MNTGLNKAGIRILPGRWGCRNVRHDSWEEAAVEARRVTLRNTDAEAPYEVRAEECGVCMGFHVRGREAE